jgi:hypothetical protein
MEHKITINIPFLFGLHVIDLMFEYNDISQFLESRIELEIIILDIPKKIIYPRNIVLILEIYLESREIDHPWIYLCFCCTEMEILSIDEGIV